LYDIIHWPLMANLVLFISKFFFNSILGLLFTVVKKLNVWTQFSPKNLSFFSFKIFTGQFLGLLKKRFCPEMFLTVKIEKLIFINLGHDRISSQSKPKNATCYIFFRRIRPHFTNRTKWSPPHREKIMMTNRFRKLLEIVVLRT